MQIKTKSGLLIKKPTEEDALIAYLQGLGTGVRRAQLQSSSTGAK